VIEVDMNHADELAQISAHGIEVDQAVVEVDH
jgi:hypothetical protein